MNAILNRKSIRKYTDQPVTDEHITTLLRAAMAAPSAVNEQPWEFVVIRDKGIMKRITEVQEYSQMLLEADAAIVVCGDLTKERYPGFWVQDCSAATENILIQAEDLGLGAVWLGVFPIAERVKNLQTLLNLHENIVPLAIVPVGHPAEQRQAADRFNPERIHLNQW